VKAASELQNFDFIEDVVSPTDEYWVEVDEEGRLILSQEMKERYGIRPGAQMRIKEGSKSLRLHRSITQLAKVYVELTSRCNLACRTCIRNAWEEIQGDMSGETFDRLLASLKELPSRPDVFIGGFGEPLLIPDIAGRVAQLKSVAGKVELITNGILLTEQLARNLIEVGLDTIWFSLDGATPEHYDDLRLGAALPLVLENIKRLVLIRHEVTRRPEIGISFVAMRRNIADLPALIHMSARLGASRYMVTNVFPYTEEMCKEMLYTRSADGVDSIPSPFIPRIDLPRMDLNPESQDAIVHSMRYRNNVSLNGVTLGQDQGHCPFVERGSVAIRWDGAVSPCLPLMHHYITYLHNQRRSVRSQVIGNLNEMNLNLIWDNPDYLAFRKRVAEFDFSPCTWCGGCEMSEKNEEDCFGNTFPTCGGCLWSQGVIQCP
jgi:MoaA/NifB/PqqE/SkfB family radical SAM enzyme